MLPDGICRYPFSEVCFLVTHSTFEVNEKLGFEFTDYVENCKNFVLFGSVSSIARFWENGKGRKGL